MPTSARYISVNNYKNQRQKVIQPAMKQSPDCFSQIWTSLSRFESKDK